MQETNKELETAITDIEEQKEIEKRKDEFISVASHELKTPLTTIKAFFQLVQKDIPEESKSHQLISRASRQVERMERLISDLLDVSRINAGQLEYNPEFFAFEPFLIDAIQTIQEIYPNRSLIIEKSVPVTIKADKHHIAQVIVNLLNNAIKYSPANQPVIIRSVIKNDKLTVAFQDFGKGIDKKHFGDLFKKFRRVNIDKNFQGLGLGLYISSEIIERHRGNITVESEPGKGAVFTFELPLDSVAT